MSAFEKKKTKRESEKRNRKERKKNNVTAPVKSTVKPTLPDSTQQLRKPQIPSKTSFRSWGPDKGKRKHSFEQKQVYLGRTKTCS